MDLNSPAELLFPTNSVFFCKMSKKSLDMGKLLSKNSKHCILIVMSKKAILHKVSTIQLLLVIFAALAAGLLYIYLSYRIKSTKIVTYERNRNTILVDDKSITPYTNIPSGKLWYETNGTVGAEYDFIIDNTTDHDFVDWTITIGVPSGYIIDSTWAGDFYLEYTDTPPIKPARSDMKEYETQTKADLNQITVTAPADYNQFIHKGKSINFGIIMYTDYEFRPKRFTITGRHIYRVYESGIFISLAVLISVDIIALIIAFFTQMNVKIKMKQYEERKKYYNEIIIQAFKTFANFVDAKDPYTRGHSIRVANYAREIARRLNYSEEEQQTIFWEGLMHDVGKISVSDAVLKKPTRLTSEEYSEIQKHTLKGFEMLSDFSSMPNVREVALSHHERWDGNGYPNRLNGEAIPLDARIIGVCDAFDAMNTSRCYRPKLSDEVILMELKNNSGTQFDPKLAKIMISMINDGFIDSLIISDNPLAE